MTSRKSFYRGVAAAALAVAVAAGVTAPASGAGESHRVRTLAVPDPTTAPVAVAPEPGTDKVLISSTGSNQVVEYDPSEGTSQVVLGRSDGVAGTSASGAASLGAAISAPKGLVALNGGSFVVADSGNQRVLLVSRSGVDVAAGTIKPVAGNGSGAALTNPTGLAVSGSKLYTSDPTSEKVFVTPAFATAPTPTTDLYAGGGSGAGSALSAEPARLAVDLTQPTGLAVVGAMLYVSEPANDRVVSIDGTNARVALASGLDNPTGLAAGTGTGLLIADSDNERIARSETTGATTIGAAVTVAGVEDQQSASGDPDGDALATKLKRPQGAGVDADDPDPTHLLFADTGADRVRAIEDSPATPSSGGVTDPAVATSTPRPAARLSPAEPTSLAPAVGKRATVNEVSGSVKVKVLGSSRYKALDGATSIPIGSTVDARRGKVRLTSAANAKGKTQSALFYEGVFTLRQKKARKPVTELVLAGPRTRCGKPATTKKSVARTARRKSRVRHLWGRGKGKFRTRGRYGAATVRGTTWGVFDTCVGTKVVVKSGLVSVRDFKRMRNVLVRKGHSYLIEKNSSKKRSRR